jgi:hypothetical protein
MDEVNFGYHEHEITKIKEFLWYLKRKKNYEKIKPKFNLNTKHENKKEENKVCKTKVQTNFFFMQHMKLDKHEMK